MLTALLCLGNFTAHSEILFAERFTYPDGPVTEKAAPFWRNLTGTPGKIRIDNGALRAAEGEFEIVETLFEGRPYSDATLYASFSLTVTALPSGTGAYVAAFSAADGPRTVGRVLVTSEGAAPGTYRLGVSTAFPRPLAILPDELQLNTAYRVLIRLIVSPVVSPGDFPFRSTLWLNPVSEAEGGLQAPDYTPIPGAIAGFAFRQGLKDDEGNGMGAVTIDDLVVATTFEEAKAGPPPEPQWTYTTQAGAVTITGYTGERSYVRVPEKINDLPVTRIGRDAFRSSGGNPKFRLQTLTLPSGLTTIEERAFWGSGITRITIPVGVTSIGMRAFTACLQLTNVEIHGPVTNIAFETFNACYSLARVSYPDSVRNFDDYAFADCTSLRDISLPSGLTRIGNAAFLRCHSLMTNQGTFKIPATVTEIAGAFYQCYNVNAFEVDPLNATFSSLNGILMNKDRTTLIQCPPGKPGAVVIPEGVTEIRQSAFATCKTLTRVILPQSVTDLPGWTFLGCTGLTHVELPAGLTSLGSSAFAGCTALRTLIIPGSVRTLGMGVFDLLPDDGTGPVNVDLYFEGNRPTAGPDALTALPEHGPTVYYRPGTTGWQSTFAGRPARLWDPRVTSGDGAPGFRDGKFGFTLTGAPGLSVAVEACTDLTNPVWVRLGTHVLTDGTAPFLDADSANHPGRYYRFQFP